MAFDDHDIPESDGLDYTGLDVSDSYDFDLGPDQWESPATPLAEDADEGVGAYDALVGLEDTGHVVKRPTDARRVPSMVGGVLCVGVAVLCLVLFVYTLFLKPSGASHILGFGRSDSSESLSDNRAEIQLPVYVPELDSRGSRIPVAISGALANGSAYTKDTYVSYDGKGLRLEPGTYELRMSGSPISAGGILYEVPETIVLVQVGEGLDVSFDPGTSLMFSSIGAISVTDAQIEEAKAFIANDPERNLYADSLAERARTRREDAKREADAAAATLASQQAAAAAAAAAAQEQMLIQEQSQDQNQNQYQNQDTATDPTTDTAEGDSKTDGTTDGTTDGKTPEDGSTNQDEYEGVPWQGDTGHTTPSDGSSGQGGSSQQGGTSDTGDTGGSQETPSDAGAASLTEAVD